MNKDKVIKAAFCFYRNDSFEVRSPFLPSGFGIGDTAEEAWTMFTKVVNEWDADNNGNGPEPDRHEQTMRLRRETENVLYRIRDEFNCSLDEALDILAARYQFMVLPQPAVTDPK
jgi:hypothetical protein